MDLPDEFGTFNVLLKARRGDAITSECEFGKITKDNYATVPDNVQIIVKPLPRT